MNGAVSCSCLTEEWTNLWSSMCCAYRDAFLLTTVENSDLLSCCVLPISSNQSDIFNQHAKLQLSECFLCFAPLWLNHRGGCALKKKSQEVSKIFQTAHLMPTIHASVRSLKSGFYLILISDVTEAFNLYHELNNWMITWLCGSTGVPNKVVGARPTDKQMTKFAFASIQGIIPTRFTWWNCISSLSHRLYWETLQICSIMATLQDSIGTRAATPRC